MFQLKQIVEDKLTYQEKKICDLLPKLKTIVIIPSESNSLLVKYVPRDILAGIHVAYGAVLSIQDLENMGIYFVNSGLFRHNLVDSINKLSTGIYYINYSSIGSMALMCGDSVWKTTDVYDPLQRDVWLEVLRKIHKHTQTSCTGSTPLPVYEVSSHCPSGYPQH
jgi:hypothetical protein